MSVTNFEKDLAAAERAPADPGRFQRANLGYIEDVLAALEPYGEDPWTESRATEAILAAPFTDPLRHVGRNDPCPCGSGRKFKKCCLD